MQKNSDGWGISEIPNKNCNESMTNAWNFPGETSTAEGTPHCQLCSNTVNLSQHAQSVSTERNELLRNFGVQLSINRDEIPSFFTKELSYICGDCKQDLECMWELQQQASQVALRLQNKVVSVAQQGLVRKPVISGTFDAIKFIMFRDIIIKNYYKNNRDSESAGMQAESHQATVTSPMVPQFPIAPVFNFENPSHFPSFGSPSSLPKPVAAPVAANVKNEPVIEQDDTESETDVTDDVQDKIFEIEPPEGWRGKTWKGVKIFNCVDNQNGIKFFQCGACPYRAHFGWNATVQQKQEMMKELLRPHIRDEHPNQNSRLQRKPHLGKYCCRVCNKRFSYRRRYRNHLKTHPEWYLEREWTPNLAGMPMLSPVTTVASSPSDRGSDPYTCG